LRVLEKIRAFEPDIVYVWNPAGIGSAAIFDLLNQVEVPWALHLMDRVPTDIAANVPAIVLGLFGSPGAGLYRGARVLAMSEHLLEEIEQTVGVCFPQEVAIVPGWADLTGARPHTPYLRDGSARFVTAGAMKAHKGIDLILEASARLKADGADFSVTLIGDGDLPYYLARAHALQVDDRVHFLGSRSQRELIELYADFDCFLFPTWEREPFGFAPIEAAGCGTPPIMTANCGASERLVDAVHCLKIQRTAEDLAATMGRVASGEVDLARMGSAAARLVRSDMSLSRCVDRIEAALAGYCRSWSRRKLDDPHLKLLLFLKHNMSVSLRFG
jgi:glycosyltransferase involved in cell wall biosynthesis